MTVAAQSDADPAFDLEVPTGWLVAGSDAGVGSALTVIAPVDRGHVSALYVDTYERGPDTADDPIPRLHGARVVELLDTMTDARLVDGVAAPHDGREGYRATVVYRHGPYLVTAFLWTLEAPFGALTVLGITDSDRLGIDAGIFNAAVQSVTFGAARAPA